MTTTYSYQGFQIQIVEKMHKKEFVYYIFVAGRPLSFVSDKRYAVDVAKRYVDVLLDDYHTDSKTEPRHLREKRMKLEVV